ncbi:MAG: hypothetical protein FWG64_13435 [Firmicutes bacterium]|nr:hypothetical protein [Bacillota bacterium]
MTSICKVDIRKVLSLFANLKLECSGKTHDIISLCDTGAGICSMSYGLWQHMGLDEVIFNDNPPLMKLLGIKSKNELTFDNLPMTAVDTKLGNGVVVKTYEFYLDTLTLGIRSLSNVPVVLEKITVRLIDSNEVQFLIGWNVLKYLEVTYKPSENEAIYTFKFTAKGKNWLETDRKNKISNYMTSRFSYLSQDNS